MQHTLTELERTPDSSIAHSQPATGKEPPASLSPLRLCLYILRGALMLALTFTIFYHGVTMIHQNAKALGFFVQNFDVPLPFLLIGLWGIAVLTTTILSIIALSKIVRLLSR